MSELPRHGRGVVNNTLGAGSVIAGICSFIVFTLNCAAYVSLSGGSAALVFLLATVPVVAAAVGILGVGVLRIIRQIESRPDASRLIQIAARMLPDRARQDCLEEWQAWLLDLREEGIPWYQRVLELVSLVLVALPSLAWRLRRSRQAAD